jgi:glycosyltransferase involved in cell wall biosynthesis
MVAIARNEAGRIGRALASVRGSVQTWLIIDTGSTDNTMDEIRAATEGWPGALLSRPWVDFGSNRTELLSVAREMDLAEWLLTIDADHVVEGAHYIADVVNKADRQGVSAVSIPFTTVPLVWTPRLIRANVAWRYVGATREYLTCNESFKQKKVDEPKIRDYADGASRTDKWRRDVALLREELSEYPENARSWFYLGESYRGLDQPELAAIAYTNCSVKTSSNEERYLALTMSGEMLLAHGDTEEGLQRLLLANQVRPQRREALLMACQVLNQMGRHRQVLTLLKNGGPRRGVPKDDITAIVPVAYGSAMVREYEAAKVAASTSRQKKRA